PFLWSRLTLPQSSRPESARDPDLRSAIPRSEILWSPFSLNFLNHREGAYSQLFGAPFHSNFLVLSSSKARYEIHVLRSRGFMVPFFLNFQDPRSAIRDPRFFAPANQTTPLGAAYTIREPGPIL